ncbi:beta-mannosidase [bacterium A37T11]|nr:beta-mannosidase [bacterium A37T11]
MKQQWLLILFMFTSLTSGFSQHSVDTAHLWQPYRISPRTLNQHIDLAGSWELSYLDQPLAKLSELDQRLDPFQTTVPNSVHWSMYYAGKLPHPYAHLNSEKYRWLETKVWYYRKSVIIPPSAKGKYIYLSFEGIDYFSRVWVNGKLLGDHEGMFGGPVMDISTLVTISGANEIVVEVRAANWGKIKNNTNVSFNPRVSGRIVRPWVIGGGSGTEAFFVLGMWQGARIDIVPKTHLERPFIETINANNQKAQLHLSCELFVNQSTLGLQLHPWGNTQINHPNEKGTSFTFSKEKPELEIRLINQGKIAYSETVKPLLYEGRNFVEQDIEIINPELWNPNGLGDPKLYQVQLVLKDNGKTTDELSFSYGIRDIQRVPTAAIRTVDRWENWQFIINGKKIFVKGMNWTPADLLLDLSPQRYRWALQAAKDMGVQLIRVWGGGLLETDTFYNMCDELGIMVWQDFPIGNQDTPDYPQDIWEAEVVQNIFRLRNHPSLIVWSGGNEFNPYSYGNAATIGILERNLQIFDPTRLFVRTSPDAGAAHIYPDMDPNWYKRSYKNEPWISETGMHSMPEANLFYELVNPKEFFDLGKMWDTTFYKQHPEFIHHFTEYGPSRVPRMISRASQMDNMNNPSLESITEASQVGAGEWYQIVSENVQSNYPVTAGLMPWVFKRHWPVIAIQMMDWFGQPGAPYYFLKRTYEPTHVSLDLERLLWKPGENVKLVSKIIQGPYAAISGATITISCIDDEFKLLSSQHQIVQIPSGTSVTTTSFDAFAIPNDYKDRFLFLLAELKDSQGKIISTSLYNLRVLSLFETEPQLFASYLNEPIPWISFPNGPWLRPAVAKTQTKVSAKIIDKHKDGADWIVKLLVMNEGAIPAYMTKIDLLGAKRIFTASDNYFWLNKKEEKEITLRIQWREEISNKKCRLVIAAWNAKENSLSL